MPWNDQSKNSGPQGGGGGPWGSGPRQPWGQPPRQPQQPQGPDLEDMLRRFQERFRFGGGRGGDRGIRPGNGLYIAGGLLLAAWVASGIYIVNPSELGVVTRFGAYVGPPKTPGLHIHLPFPIEDARVESVTRPRTTLVGLTAGGQNIETESQMLTGDRSIGEISFTVLWQLSDVRDYVFNVNDPEGTVKSVAESSMREVIGKSELDDVITRNRSQVEQSTQELIQRTLDSYRAGVQVVSVQINSAQPPPEVIEAFQDVIRAGSDQVTKSNEATRYANEKVPQARGEAAALLQSAEAYREQAVREAEGEAQRFTSVLGEYRKAPRVTRERLYLETMERVYGGADKVIIDSRTGVVPYMPLDQLRSQQQQQQQRPAVSQ